MMDMKTPTATAHGHEQDYLYVGTTRGDRNKRTLYYGHCRCGWGSKTRATAERVRQDWREHVKAES